MEKHFGLRIDEQVLKKFRYVCAFKGRSANSQIIQLILKCIEEYESVHGEISIEENKQTK